MFLPVNINSGGYIRWKKRLGNWATVHRETRQLHYERNACKSLDEAKAELSTKMLDTEVYNAILELTSDGGGHAIFVKVADEEEIKRRLTVWRSCYGKWETRLLREE